MANNRKVRGSNPGSVAFAFLFTRGRSIIICQGRARCLAGVCGQRECVQRELWPSALCSWQVLCALSRSAPIRVGIVWASFGASFKDYMFVCSPSISKGGLDNMPKKCKVLGWRVWASELWPSALCSWQMLCALSRSASIRVGIVWASFGASFKDYMLPDLAPSENVQDLGHDFLGHRFGWGPHRFAYLSHPCRGSGPFLINLLALNSDGGSYIYCHCGYFNPFQY